MKLYTFFRSSASFRVRIALNHKGLKYEHAGVSLPKGEHLEAGYKSLNAQGLVPALEDGGRLLTQSLAIMEYLDEVHPGPKLRPADPFDRSPGDWGRHDPERQLLAHDQRSRLLRDRPRDLGAAGLELGRRRLARHRLERAGRSGSRALSRRVPKHRRLVVVRPCGSSPAAQFPTGPMP